MTNIAHNMQGADSLDESDVVVGPDGAQHNPQNPAIRLPPEIIGHIFAILSSIDEPQPLSSIYQPPYAKNGSMGWLTVTHVCQRWRSVALENPSLWASNITLPCLLGVHWANTFLSRAQDAPLEIRCPTVDFDWRYLLPGSDTVSAYLARTRVLCLNASDAALRLLCNPAPLLRTLDIKYVSDPTDPTVPLNALPEDLLGGATGAPSLLHLSLESRGPLPSPWTLSILAGLKSLNVKNGSRWIEREELAEMFTTLGGMPALEQLTLRLKLTPFALETAPQPVVALPSLRKFKLVTDIASACHVLARVALPATASVHCDIYFTESSAKLHALLSAAAACIHVRAAPIARIEILPTIIEGQWMCVDVTAWRTKSADLPALSMSFRRCSQDARVDQGLVAAVLATLGSAHLAVLAIGSDGSDATWPAALHGAHALRRVWVAGLEAKQFCAALAAAPAGFLPALATLEIHDVDFGEGEDAGLAGVLAQGLEQRAHAGSALRTLTFVGCKLEDAQVYRMIEAVPWLGVQIVHGV
ncbi:hypothetical protein FA95DRAFT_1564261 [Auriscalpium vulgare]|uniref:Uncharacterized protein n=1 Tax=Auriscalpium vulgare TaxID=40419 RepID=A0ACB8RFT0_9AGAM|nr:hypothetical protein FA95DRAFT_1564261 [Auriscalpium vulgare]